MNRTNIHRIKCIVTVISLMLVTNLHANETIRFNVVKDKQDVRHISMIPEPGYTLDGKIKDKYNPNSIVYQYAKMLEELRKENLELARQSVEEETPANRTRMFEDRPPREQVPGNEFSRTNDRKSALEKLIELDNRAGRSTPVENHSP